MGLFVTLADPTAPMKMEAASAGVLDTPFGKIARLQILTIEDLFAGKKPAMPPQDPMAFKKAAREEDKTRQGQLI
jgi:site-specific DNA-methyltransferase (adenine-specific)